MTRSGGPDANPPTIDCLTTVRRLWDYLDGRLSAVSHDEVEAHLAICAQCSPHFLFAERMKRSLARGATTEISSDDESALRDRIRGALGRISLDNDSGS